MTKDDIASIAKGFAPVMRDLVDAKTAPLERRIEVLERQLAEAKRAAGRRAFGSVSDEDAMHAVEGMITR